MPGSMLHIKITVIILIFFFISYLGLTLLYIVNSFYSEQSVHLTLVFTVVNVLKL